MNERVEISHPGNLIRNGVIPPDMSVTKAAELMAIGRPALSNLLNGNSNLSADMAARLAKAFNYPLEDLMKMQARYDAAQAKQKNAPSNTKSFVPLFLAVKANNIETWVEHNIRARSRLAVLLRTLVHSTGSGLTKVDFPGNDDAERPGLDGLVEAGEGTPWVPAGRSGWEFGTNDNARTKADGDFEKCVKAFDKTMRTETTFVFVTPRRWAGKATWVADNKAKGLWKDVRAYDSSDLEQWLEQSLPAQTWFANETHMLAHNVRSLDKCWADWANVSSPPLTGTLFNSAIEATKRKILSRLSKPSEGPIRIAADSIEEALAFLAQLLGENGGEELALYRDRVLVFDKPGILPRLAAGAQTFIPVVFTREVEIELGPYANLIHSIVVHPCNAATTEPDIVLEPANYETFNKALEEMGKNRDEISQLANASGRSLTVLRRQLSTVLAVRMPEWAADHQIATNLVPFLFVGTWNDQNETDKEGLSLLSNGCTCDELERICQRLTQLNDAPVWSLGTYRGVISKIDLLYAIAGTLTYDDLNRYFSMAHMVLSEDDPALDLEEGKRWLASVHGKTRKFSSAFRKGISETLVLLAVHGKSLFKNRLGFDTELEAIKLVRKLLPAPLTTRILEANDQDLPTYAEAAPDEFLLIIERDLKAENPAVLGLLRPASSGMFGHPSRTGLLWALEGLSWNPDTLPRTAFILACLAEVEISDNWVNKPMHSLESIFRAWMPQTAASHQVRVYLMKELSKKFPSVAWKICIAQFGNHHQVGDYSHKPRWRSDGFGFGEPSTTLQPIIDFIHEMVEMALTWKSHSVEMLCDLITRLHDLTDTDQDRVWNLVKEWANTRAIDADKAVMREKIRVTAFSRIGTLRAKKNERLVALKGKAMAAYQALEPTDVLNKYAWLFRDSWVDESADEIEEIENLDFQKREVRIQDRRIKALSEIQLQLGAAGLLELSERGKASSVIGGLAATAVLSHHELQELLRLALAQISAGSENVHSCKNLIAGSLRATMDEDKRETTIKAVMADLSEVDKVRLLTLAPYRKSTWKIIDALSEASQTKYWSEVIPDWIQDSDSEISESVERLLMAGRPRAAFSSIRFKLEKIDVQVLFHLLSDMAQGGNDQPGHYQLEHYNVEEAFKHLNGSSILTLDQKAGLEFAYIDVLVHSRGRRESSGIPNLERYVEIHPESFVQAVVWAYKRNDGATDPADFTVLPDRIKSIAEQGYNLLEAIQRIPGHNDLGELEAPRLGKWIATVRRSCAELGRLDIADICIGKLLSCAPVGIDGVWPCEVVRDSMEEIQSESIMQGAHTGLYNSRGVHMRALGEGGNQERELAEKYHKWSQALQISHPFVASQLLTSMSKTYEYEASQYDTDAGIKLRLH